MLAKIGRGVTWTYAAIAFGAVIQLGVTAVTARLLDPAVFGLVAMANVLISFGSYFAQMGVGRALIQRPEINDDDIRAAFTSSTLLGLAVAGIVVAAAPFAAGFFRTDEVVPVLRWLALTFVATGLGATAQALLRRRLRFKGSGFVEVVAYALGFGLPAITLAFAGFGVWSLVVGAIGQRVVASGLAFLLTRHSLWPTFQFDAHRRLLGFGTKVSGISLLEFLGSTLDTIVIGRFGTAAQLGLYNRAFMLASLPTYQIQNGIGKVLFPVLASGQNDRVEFREALHKVTTIAIRILLPTGIGMALVAPELVTVVLGEKWLAAVPLFGILALAMPLNLLATFPGIALESIGALRGKLIAQTVYVVVLVVALLMVATVGELQLFDVAMVVMGAYMVRVAMYFMLALAADTYDLRSLLRQLAIAAASLIVAAMLIGGSVTLMRAFEYPAWVVVAAAMVAGILALFALFAHEIRTYGLSWAQLRSGPGKTKCAG